MIARKGCATRVESASEQAVATGSRVYGLGSGVLQVNIFQVAVFINGYIIYVKSSNRHSDVPRPSSLVTFWH